MEPQISRDERKGANKHLFSNPKVRKPKGLPYFIRAFSCEFVVKEPHKLNLFVIIRDIRVLLISEYLCLKDK